MVQWDLGTALYDAVQIEQLRGELDQALDLGRAAATALVAGATGREPNAADEYLLGRLHYRLGAIYALGEGNHIRATEWYDQALAWLNRPASEVPPQLLLPWGEMLVSMGVSYWEAGTQAQAIELTLAGTRLMEQAVQRRQADQDVLSVPYGNLARMFDGAGDAAQAARYRRLAGKSDTSIVPR
jgi:tetratricopeptide (TPR) repeat protein